MHRSLLQDKDRINEQKSVLFVSHSFVQCRDRLVRQMGCGRPEILIGTKAA